MSWDAKITVVTEIRRSVSVHCALPLNKVFTKNIINE